MKIKLSPISMGGRFRKIIILVKGVFIFRDWHIWLGEHLGFRMKHGKFRLRDGTTFFINPWGGDSIDAFQEIYLQKRYTKFYTPKENDVVIDIGGAIGEFAIYCANLSPSIHVYAYEPESGAFARMKKAIEYNRLEHRITGFNIAVASQQGELTIESKGNIFWPDSSYIAKATTLQDIFKQNNISWCNFLKMDIEGAEFEILPQTPRSIFDKIGHIALEYHNANPSQLYQLLMSYGFNVKMFSSSNDCGYLYGDK